MLAALKRLIFILFWEAIAILVILLLPKQYYIFWLISCIILLFVLLILSSKIIPTKKEKNKLLELSKVYKSFIDKDFDIKTKANLLEFTCPSCEFTTNFRDFLTESECPKCNSRLWTTKIMDKGQEYYDIFLDNEKIENFISKLSFRQKSKLKKLVAGI